ncbi:hypothetical protein L6R50_15810 [Myxococcota bacterium]|nr:hypothetical protein [Myxococcota bacterium]
MAVLIATLGWGAAAPASEGGLRAVFPNGAALVVDGGGGTEHGGFTAGGASLVFRGGPECEVRYDLEALDPAAGGPGAAVEALLAARLGEREAHRPDLGPLDWAARMGVLGIWLAQTVGGRAVGRPPALAVVADLPRQRLALVQATFPWKESWRANAGLVELLRRARFEPGGAVGEEPTAAGPGPAAGRGSAGPGDRRPADAPFDPFGPPREEAPSGTTASGRGEAGGPRGKGKGAPAPPGDVVVGLPGGGELVFRDLPSRGWTRTATGVARVAGPHRLEVRVVELGAMPPAVAAVAALDRAAPGGVEGGARALRGTPAGARGAAFAAEAEVGPPGREDHVAAVAFTAAGRTVGLVLGPLPAATWRRWRAEVEASLGRVAFRE